VKTLINFNEWKGKKHYLWFKKYPIHYYNVVKRIDITELYNYIKTNNLTFFIPLMYIVNRAMNEFEEFRLRQEGEGVYLYDIIHPAYTVMTEEGIFDNCDSNYSHDFKTYYEEATQAIAEAKIGVKEDVPYNDESRFDQYYFTSLPWMDYLSVSHPMPLDDSDYVPRICWGKYTKENGRITLSIGIQVSHAFVDGYPLSQAFNRIQEMLDRVEEYLK
jgi:chloramphenicol O-acetyltransferase type A